jgi:hypothetical protein
MKTMMKYSFVSQFINTAFIILLVYSNFEHAHLPFIKDIFNG